MKNLRNIIVLSNAPVFDAIKILNDGKIRTVMVLDKNDLLVGTITDGDVRRGLIRHVRVEDACSKIMNTTPLTTSKSANRKKLQSQMRAKHITAVPVLDESGRLIDVFSLDAANLKTRSNPVVIMAGGLGTRLGELTLDCPKPMLKVGGRPILHTIVEKLTEYGFANFYLSVNYKAEMIEDYFGDGSAFGANIKYIKETERMGTAGSLSLLPSPESEPVLVINGDVLTKVNFNELLENHERNQYLASMCVRKFDFQVPYGVIQTEGDFLKSIEEKPMQSFFVNAGIYVINSELLREIPKSGYFDMPSLFNNVLASKRQSIGVFPVHEYWMDVGIKDEFERAKLEFLKVF